MTSELEEEALTEDEDGVVGAEPLEEDEEEYEYEDWVDEDGTKYYLIKAKNNLLLDYTEQTIVGRLVDGVKVDAEEE